MSGQGERHSEKVDICAYSSNSSRMGSSPPAKLVTIIRIDKRFQYVSKRCGIHTKKGTNIYTSIRMNGCLVRVKNKMQLISSLYKPKFCTFE